MERTSIGDVARRERKSRPLTLFSVSRSRVKRVGSSLGGSSSSIRGDITFIVGFFFLFFLLCSSSSSSSMDMGERRLRSGQRTGSLNKANIAKAEVL